MPDLNRIEHLWCYKHRRLVFKNQARYCGAGWAESPCRFVTATITWRDPDDA